MPVELQGEMQIGVIPGNGLGVSSTILNPVAFFFPWQEDRGGTQYVLFPVSKPQIKVNGNLIYGMKVLNDQDEICFRCPNTYIWFRAYFSTESLPMKNSFESDNPTFCIRCKLKIEKREEVVKCPQCRLIYHESNNRRCWSYDEKCSGCSRSTKMEYTWKPDPVPTVRKKRNLRVPLERGNIPQ